MMNFKETLKPAYSIENLSVEKFNKNPSFYQKSFDEITISQNLCTENWTDFFTNHPINSITYIKKNDKIVSFIYATPHRDYEIYDDTDLEHWVINYIKTHKHFEGNGYSYLVTIAGLEDMKKKGAKQVDFLPNQKSSMLFKKIIDYNNIGNLVNSKQVGRKIIIFNKSFLNIENCLNREK